MKKIYLCGGINGLSDSECRDWRELVKSRLANRYEFLDPMRRDYRGREIGNEGEIVRLDLADIDACDIVLVNATKPSWGTAMELLYGFQKDKVVVSVSGKDGIVSPWVSYHSLVVRDWDAAIVFLSGSYSVKM